MSYIETFYESCDETVKGWKNADTVIFLVWGDADEKEKVRQKGEKHVANFMKKHPEAVPAGLNGSAFNGEGKAYNGDWLIEYRLEKSANLD